MIEQTYLRVGGIIFVVVLFLCIAAKVVIYFQETSDLDKLSSINAQLSATTTLRQSAFDVMQQAASANDLVRSNDTWRSQHNALIRLSLPDSASTYQSQMNALEPGLEAQIQAIEGGARSQEDYTRLTVLIGRYADALSNCIASLTTNLVAVVSRAAFLVASFDVLLLGLVLFEYFMFFLPVQRVLLHAQEERRKNAHDE